MVRHDRADRFRFTTAQSEAGQALYRRAPGDFDHDPVIVDPFDETLAAFTR
jgi:predicted DCC family thiol-disulfide oxidoreductase YuxK